MVQKYTYTTGEGASNDLGSDTRNHSKIYKLEIMEIFMHEESIFLFWDSIKCWESQGQVGWGQL